MIGYIPDEDLEEETLISARIDSAIDRLRKRRYETILFYIDEETNDAVEIRMESPLKS